MASTGWRRPRNQMITWQNILGVSGSWRWMKEIFGSSFVGPWKREGISPVVPREGCRDSFAELTLVMSEVTRQSIASYMIESLLFHQHWPLHNLLPCLDRDLGCWGRHRDTCIPQKGLKGSPWPLESLHTRCEDRFWRKQRMQVLSPVCVKDGAH